MPRPLSNLYNDRSFQLSAELCVKKNINSAVWYNGKIIYDWAMRRFSSLELPMRMQSGIFERNGHEVEVLYLPDENYFCLRARHPDEKVAQRTWTVEAEIFSADESLRLGVKVSYTTPIEAIMEDRSCFSVPTFVRRIMQKNGMTDVVRLHGGVHRPEDETDLKELLSLIEDQDRLCPVVVVTPRVDEYTGRDGEYLIDTDSLALGWDGIEDYVHVFEIPTRLVEKWMKIAGSASVYGGSVRTYYPKLNLEEIDYASAPLVLANKIDTSYYVDTKGEEHFSGEAFGYILRDKLRLHNCRMRLNWSGLGHKYYFQKRREILRQRIDANRQSGAVTQEILEVYESQISDLQKDLEQKEQDVMTALETAEQIEQQLAHERDLIRRQKSYIDSLESLLQGKGIRQDIPFPEEYEEIQEWVEKYFPGRLLLLPRAIGSIKRAEFEDVKMVSKCLQLLGGTYAKMRQGLVDRKQFDSECATLGITESATITDNRAGEQGETYFVMYKGKRHKMERHLKNKSNARDPRRCLRIYFFWDEEDGITVLCSLPGHLEIRIS